MGGEEMTVDLVEVIFKIQMAALILHIHCELMLSGLRGRTMFKIQWLWTKEKPRCNKR
jgi:hypothetical protein